MGRSYSCYHCLCLGYLQFLIYYRALFELSTGLIVLSFFCVCVWDTYYLIGKQIHSISSMSVDHLLATPVKNFGPCSIS